MYFCGVQAIQNVMRHADNAPAVMTLHLADGALHFELTDQGPGFSTDARPEGRGLQTLRDRLQALGGELSIMTRPGSGTTVTGQLPLETAPPAIVLTTADRLPRGLEPVGAERRLRDVGGGPALRRLGRVLVLLVGGEQQHDHGLGGGEDLPRRLEPVDARQVDVHQHQVGCQGGRHGDGVLARLGLAHDLEAVRGLHDHAGGHPEGLLVIHDQHSNGHLIFKRPTRPLRMPVVPAPLLTMPLPGRFCAPVLPSAATEGRGLAMMTAPPARRRRVSLTVLAAGILVCGLTIAPRARRCGPAHRARVHGGAGEHAAAVAGGRHARSVRDRRARGAGARHRSRRHRADRSAPRDPPLDREPRRIPRRPQLRAPAGDRVRLHDRAPPRLRPLGRGPAPAALQERLRGHPRDPSPLLGATSARRQDLRRGAEGGGRL